LIEQKIDNFYDSSNFCNFFLSNSGKYLLISVTRNKKTKKICLSVFCWKKIIGPSLKIWVLPSIPKPERSVLFWPLTIAPYILQPTIGVVWGKWIFMSATGMTAAGQIGHRPKVWMLLLIQKDGTLIFQYQHQAIMLNMFLLKADWDRKIYLKQNSRSGQGLIH
jgi:hypothetical protein